MTRRARPQTGCSSWTAFNDDLVLPTGVASPRPSVGSHTMGASQSTNRRVGAMVRSGGGWLNTMEPGRGLGQIHKCLRLRGRAGRTWPTCPTARSRRATGRARSATGSATSRSGAGCGGSRSGWAGDPRASPSIGQGVGRAAIHNRESFSSGTWHIWPRTSAGVPTYPSPW